MISRYGICTTRESVVYRREGRVEEGGREGERGREGILSVVGRTVWYQMLCTFLRRYDVRIHMDYIPDYSKLPEHQWVLGLCQQYQHCVNVVSTLCQMLCGVVLKLMLGCGVVYALELCIYSFSFVPFVAFVASSSNFIPQSQMLRRPGNKAPQFSLTNFLIMST